MGLDSTLMERSGAKTRAKIQSVKGTADILPEDAYDDWAIAARERSASAVVSARRRLARVSADGERWDDAIDHARGVLELDGFDERAHELLVATLLAAGRRGRAGPVRGQSAAPAGRGVVEPAALA